MSIRVMLVDDEPISSRATSLMVKKTSPKLEVISLCHSGRHAIEQAALLHPDIVVMDIQMAGINGLTAIRKIKQTNPHTFFIVLSAYSEFSFAAEALSLGVCDYLLKPVKQKDFSDALYNAMRKVQSRTEAMEQELRQQEQLQVAYPVIQKEFIAALYSPANSENMIQMYADFLNVTKETGIVAAFSQKNETPFSILAELISQPLLRDESIADVVDENLAVAYFSINDDADPDVFYNDTARRLNALLLDAVDGSVVAGMSSMCPIDQNIEHLNVLMRQALSALKIQTEGPRQVNPVLSFDKEKHVLLDDVIPARDTAEATTGTVQAVINLAKTYILDHYQNEITLEDVSSKVNLSPYYFSRLFKEHAGCNFSDYLFNTRIERAKYLLKNSASSVKEVAYQVGYRDPNYFSRIFHRATGIKASDYKELGKL